MADEARLRPTAGQKLITGGTELVWREARPKDSVIDFNELLTQPSSLSAAYAVCYVHAEQALNGLTLKIGRENPTRVYLNGKLIFERRSSWSTMSDPETVGALELQAGLSVIVLKVVNERYKRDTSQASFRFTDQDGNPVKGLSVTTNPDEP